MDCRLFGLCALLAAALAAFAPVADADGAEGVLFASLPKTLIVTATVNGQTITAANDVVMNYKTGNLAVTWNLNSTVTDTSAYKSIQFKMCFGAADQDDRPWRANDPGLLKSKTCKYPIHYVHSFVPSGNFTINKATLNTIEQIPQAHYFVRAFVMNVTNCTVPGNCAIAFGQTANKNRTSPLFFFQAYTGRHGSLVATTIAISVTSYLALGAFFVVEKALRKRA
jgi:hypothetical protein